MINLLIGLVARLRPRPRGLSGLAYMNALDPSLSVRKSDAAFILNRIRPVDTRALIREVTGLMSARFTVTCEAYIRSFEMAWSEGANDEFLVEQLESDTRLDEAEKLLILEARAELALRDLQALLDGVYSVEPSADHNPPRDPPVPPAARAVLEALQ